MAMGDTFMPKSKTLIPIERLHYCLNLPTSNRTGPVTALTLLIKQMAERDEALIAIRDGKSKRPAIGLKRPRSKA
jgi:hypothetical protein